MNSKTFLNDVKKLLILQKSIYICVEKIGNIRYYRYRNMVINILYKYIKKTWANVFQERAIFSRRRGKPFGQNGETFRQKDWETYHILELCYMIDL